MRNNSYIQTRILAHTYGCAQPCMVVSIYCMRSQHNVKCVHRWGWYSHNLHAHTDAPHTHARTTHARTHTHTHARTHTHTHARSTTSARAQTHTQDARTFKPYNVAWMHSQKTVMTHPFFNSSNHAYLSFCDVLLRNIYDITGREKNHS